MAAIPGEAQDQAPDPQAGLDDASKLRLLHNHYQACKAWWQREQGQLKAENLDLKRKLEESLTENKALREKAEADAAAWRRRLGQEEGRVAELRLSIDRLKQEADERRAAARARWESGAREAAGKAQKGLDGGKGSKGDKGHKGDRGGKGA